jgi:hypothetical protein
MRLRHEYSNFTFLLTTRTVIGKSGVFSSPKTRKRNARFVAPFVNSAGAALVIIPEWLEAKVIDGDDMFDTVYHDEIVELHLRGILASFYVSPSDFHDVLAASSMTFQRFPI